MALWRIAKITSGPSSISPISNVRYTIDVQDTESTDTGQFFMERLKTEELVLADVKTDMVAAGFTPTDIP